MEPKEMIEFLKQDSLRVFEGSYTVYDIRHTNSETTIYFWNFNGYPNSYSSYVNNQEDSGSYQSLLKRLSEITIIEKRIDSEYYPIWTKEDGLITQNENFVRINGRYYTIKFLEQLLSNISESDSIKIRKSIPMSIIFNE